MVKEAVAESVVRAWAIEECVAMAERVAREYGNRREQKQHRVPVASVQQNREHYWTVAPSVPRYRPSTINVRI